MKENIKTPVIVVVALVLVAAVVALGFKFINGAGNLDQGQVQYTPGKPPWEETDPNKKGPGAAPSEEGSQVAPPQPGGPPVAPPVINNGK